MAILGRRVIRLYVYARSLTCGSSLYIYRVYLRCGNSCVARDTERDRSGHLGLMRTQVRGCRKIRSAARACPVLPGVAAVMPTSIPELSSSSLRSEGQGASPVALSVGDDTREAWSCPPPNEIFTVGSQGRDEEIAGVGVAIARLHFTGFLPPRRRGMRANPSMPPAALTLCAARFAGMAPCPLQ